MRGPLVICAIAAVLLIGTGLIWPNKTNVCNATRLPSFSGKVETAGRRTVEGTQTCWIVRVRDPRTGTLYRVPFTSKEETLKYPVGSTYSR